MYAQHNKFGITLQVEKQFLNYHSKTAENLEKSAETAQKTMSLEVAARAARMAATVKEQAKARQAAAAKAKAKAKAKVSEKEERCMLAEAIKVAARAAKAAKAAVELVEAAESKAVKPEPEQGGSAKAAKPEAAKATAEAGEAARPLVQARARPLPAPSRMQPPPATQPRILPVVTITPYYPQVQVELRKGQTIMVDVDLQMPAAILHEVVSNRSGMPPEGFALYYQSKQLEGEAALWTWGVEKDATIEVKTRGRGGTGTDPKTDEKTKETAPVQVTGAFLAAKVNDRTSSAASKMRALAMLKTMPLKEVEPQQNALRLFALNDADDDVKDAATETLKDAATETLAKLTEAMEAKEAEDELATKEAQELTRTRTEEISEKEAKQVLINAHARSGPRPRLPPLTEPTFDAPPT